MTFYSLGYAVSSGHFLSQNSLGMFFYVTAVRITVLQLIISYLNVLFNRFPLEFVGGAPRGNSIQGKVSISCTEVVEIFCEILFLDELYFPPSMTLAS